MAIAIFCNEVKGKCMLAMSPRSRDVSTRPRSCWPQDARSDGVGSAAAAIGGEGKRAEVDGGYFGGYVKPANRRENRRIAAWPESVTASARSWL